MEKQAIAFAHYKNGELLGYRADSFGTLTKNWAKIYTYSSEQVEIVLTNIRYTLGEKKRGIGNILKNMNIDPEMADIVAKAEDKIYKEGQEAGAFEVRVVKAPSPEYEREFDVNKAEYVTSPFPTYNPEAMRQWLNTPEDHEIIETHYFSMAGQLNLQ